MLREDQGIKTGLRRVAVWIVFPSGANYQCARNAVFSPTRSMPPILRRSALQMYPRRTQNALMRLLAGQAIAPNGRFRVRRKRPDVITIESQINHNLAKRQSYGLSHSC